MYCKEEDPLKTKVIMGMLTLLLVGGGYWGLNAAEQLTSDGVTIASNNSSENPPKEYTEPIIDDWEGLQVSVQWEKQDEISSQRFLIGINNHALDVDNFDFLQNVRVQLDNKEIPVKVQVLEKNGSGHHSSAELQVESPEFTKATAGSIMTLSVSNVYDTPTRNFTWKFK